MSNRQDGFNGRESFIRIVLKTRLDQPIQPSTGIYTGPVIHILSKPGKNQHLLEATTKLPDRHDFPPSKNFCYQKLQNSANETTSSSSNSRCG